MQHPPWFFVQFFDVFFPISYSLELFPSALKLPRQGWDHSSDPDMDNYVTGKITVFEDHVPSRMNNKLREAVARIRGGIMMANIVFVG